MRLFVHASRHVKIKLFIFFLLLVLIKGLIFYQTYFKIQSVFSPLPLTGVVFVVDPGHGGYDPGFFSKGVAEKEITLQIGLYLRDLLQQSGAIVVMTRVTDRDYATMPAGPLKRRDLSERLRIISEAKGAEALISIHVNSFHLPGHRGAQTFYYAGKEESKDLAYLIQDELKRVLQNTDRLIKEGDFYILKHAPCPAVIVETGFLSNPDEAYLLIQPRYQKKVAWAIYLGATRFIRE